MEDRRIFERIGARFSARLLDPFNGREAEAVTVDISANGLGLNTNAEIEKGTPFEIWLNIPDQHSPFYCRGIVVWSKGLDASGKQRIGVSLDQARLMGLARVLWTKNHDLDELTKGE